VYTKDKFKGWVGGIAQSTESPSSGDSATGLGVSGGLRWANSQVSLTGSGYWGKGIGTTLLFLGGSCADDLLGCGGNGSDDLRDSYGYIAQITYTTGKTTLAGSYGASLLKASDTERSLFETENALISAGVYHQATKSLKFVVEGNRATTEDKESSAEKNSSFALAVGFMLFF
jgi:hypothetical protein